MGNISEQIAKTEEEIRQLHNKKKKLLNQKKSEEHKILMFLDKLQQGKAD